MTPLWYHSKRTVTLAAILVGIGTLLGVTVASASKPAISLTVRASTIGGARVPVTGRVDRIADSAKVLLQQRTAKGWKRLAQTGISHGSFKTSFMAPTINGTVSLRAVAQDRGRLLAKSTTRRLRVTARKAVTSAQAGAPGGAGGDAPSAAPAALSLRTSAQTLAPGSAIEVPTPSPLSSISALDGPTAGGEAGVTVEADGGVLSIEASTAANLGSMTLKLTGTGCADEGCNRSFVMEIPLTVIPLETPPGPLETVTEPSHDRVDAAVEHQMLDEVLITVGSPDAPGTRPQAEEAAAAAGGIVSGGLEKSGIYQIRWLTRQNLDAITAVLESQGPVTSVSPASVDLYGDTSTYPVAKEFETERWTWPYKQVHALEAWNKSTGSSITVGILDEGSVYSRHEDLNVSIAPGGYNPAFHATHVAGLACAKHNDGHEIGLVGLAWGCPIVSVQWGGSFTPGVLNAMQELARMDSVKVVNVSLGSNVEGGGCAGSGFQANLAKKIEREKRVFTQFLAGPEGRRIVWTFSAGNNCAPGVASPWGANSQLPNVVTVAATNSDSTLAIFSNFGPGVEVAAPGGIDTETKPLTNGLMSTATDFGCPEFDSCIGGVQGAVRAVQCHTFLFNCSAYMEDRGTSMAAPIVAGIAALVRSVHPDLPADKAATCITSSAGTGGTGSTLGQSSLPPGYKTYLPYPEDESTPIVNAAAAVDCVPRTTASSYSGSGGGDGWAIALSQDYVYNVFHHSGVLQVACHFQVDATPCWPPEVITDNDGNNFSTSGHPGLWLDQASGRLYVFATRNPDETAGVVCVEVIEGATDPNPFCGFTALTGVGEASLNSGISALSNPALVGSRWYAFNYVNGSEVTGTRNKLLCFDVSTFSPCPGQPFAVSAEPGNDVDTPYPPPAVTAIGTRIIVPQRLEGAVTDQISCFDGNSESPCGGAWPLHVESGYVSGHGAPFPLLNASGSITGLCLPRESAPCYSLAGSQVATPAGLAEAVPGTSGWNGPALTIDARVYVPDGNRDEVDCYDYVVSAQCGGFPLSFEELGLLYTVNPDPERPHCIWVNSDYGNGQIQNFDAFTGGSCE